MNTLINQINEYIIQIEQFSFEDKSSMNSLINEIELYIIQSFGNQSDWYKSIKTIKFAPDKSYYREAAKKTTEDSWNSGKKALITLLRKIVAISQYEQNSSVDTNKIDEVEKFDLLRAKIKNPSENDFFNEAIKCFKVGAFRASIIMMWNLTMDHLFEYVISNKLVEFNAALRRNTAIRPSTRSNKDDFTELKESKFIEICRSANIITNDIRKILDEKLGTRNTCGHPNSVKVNESKVIDFIEDLVTNIILKY